LETLGGVAETPETPETSPAPLALKADPPLRGGREGEAPSSDESGGVTGTNARCS